MTGRLSGKTNFRENTFRLEFKIDAPAGYGAARTGRPLAGQFYIIKPERSSLFLGRPFSVFQYNNEDESLAFLVERRGRGTEELVSMGENEAAMLLGPLGNSFAGEIEKRFPVGGAAKIKKIALVSGGSGIAPLLFFSSQNAERNPAGRFEIDFYAGFRDKVSSPQFLRDAVPGAGRVIFAFENGGNAGNRGLVTDFFSPEGYDAVLSCGPLPMLQKAAAMCAGRRVPCFVSIEKKMACGAGACLGCTVKTKTGNRRCCKDGPVFDAEVLF